MEYVTWQEDTYVVDLCSECGKSYSERIGISHPEGELHPDPQWFCPCGTLNEMKLHSDDCPCTMGGENVCELIGWFDDDSILDEKMDIAMDDHSVVRRMFDRIHGRKTA